MIAANFRYIDSTAEGLDYRYHVDSRLFSLVFLQVWFKYPILFKCRTVAQQNGIEFSA